MCSVIFSPLGSTEYNILPSSNYPQGSRSWEWEGFCKMSNYRLYVVIWVDVNFLHKKIGLVESKECFSIYFTLHFKSNGKVLFWITVRWNVYEVLSSWLDNITWFSKNFCVMQDCPIVFQQVSTGYSCCYTVQSQLIFCILLQYSSTITWSLRLNLLENNIQLVAIMQ